MANARCTTSLVTKGCGEAGGPCVHDFSRMDVSDIFSMFNDIFGQDQGGRGGRCGVARGYDLETEVTLTLNDVLNGCERDVEFTRLDVCEKCVGSGAKAGTKPVKCPTCGGQGKVQQSGLGGMFRMVVACPACHGRSVVKEFCDACRGKGRQPKKRNLTVKVPAGIAEGQAIRVQGEGEPPPPEMSASGEGQRGDLHVVVRVEEHDRFRREGNHLVLEMPISFPQACVADVQVPTLDGPRPLSVPRGTQHEQMFRLDGLGLPDLRTGRRADLVVVAKLEVPTKLTSRQEELLASWPGSKIRAGGCRRTAMGLQKNQGRVRGVSNGRYRKKTVPCAVARRRDLRTRNGVSDEFNDQRRERSAGRAI